ncbi:MAG: hypothetical protein ABFC62_07665 [Clostridiaceae bacterium]|nr:hypothetical protein [Eubacteriales bacterium]
MKGLRKILAAALLAVLFAGLCASCAIPANVSRSQGDEHALTALKQSYRSASVVLRGVCVQTHTDLSGALCADVEVKEVLAGKTLTGGIVHCVSGGLKEGGSYLLFLGQGADVHYSEDEPAYSVIESDAVEESGSSFKLKSTGITLTEIRKELRRLDAVIGAPATSYYYMSLGELAAAADEIFLGQVVQAPELTNTAFRSQEGGGTVEQELPASVARVSAYGAVKGALKYGDTVDLIYAPAMSADVVDAATLTATTYGESAVPPLKEGAVYLFFLVRGPDPKQSYYFSVNPFQGYVPVKNDSLSVSYVNKALVPYAELAPLVRDVRAILGI